MERIKHVPDQLIIVSEVKCPVCGLMKRYEDLFWLQNEMTSSDGTCYGYALVTTCCNAIVAKSGGFDYIRCAFNDADLVARSKEIAGVLFTDKPEIYREREVAPPPPNPHTVREVILCD